MVVENLRVDVTPGGVPLVIHVSQYDAGLRQFVFTPYDKGVAMAKIAGATVAVEATKPDGYAVQHPCIYNNDGTITYTLQEQLAACEGQVWSKLTWRDSNGNVLGAKAIVWAVDMAGIADGAIVSASDLPLIEQAAEFAGEYEQKVAEMIEEMQIIPGQVVIDGTLTVQGAAADAKVVGDRITAINDTLDGLQPGVSVEAREALLDCLRYLAWISEDGQQYYDALEAALAVTHDTYSTVLFTDGTLIINERSSKRASNITAHGAVVKEYAPYSDTNHYIFTVNTSAGTSTSPWYNDRASITRVEIGSHLTPDYLRGWFTGLSECASMNLIQLDASQCRDARYMFAFCAKIRSADVASLRFGATLSDALGIFKGCSGITRLDLTGWDVSNVYTITELFAECSSLDSVTLPTGWGGTANLSGTMFVFRNCSSLRSVNVGSLDVSHSNNMRAFFQGCALLETVNISAWDVSAVVNTQDMFNGCAALRTIYCNANLNTSTVTTSTNMFLGCTNLVGGSGTVYSSSAVDKTRARVDGGTSAPGYFTAA